MKRELTLFAEFATTTAELQQQVQDVWNNLSQDASRHLYGRFHEIIYVCIAGMRDTVCRCECILWHVWFEFVIKYSYNDKLSVKSLVNRMTFSLRVLHFFRKSS